ISNAIAKNNAKRPAKYDKQTKNILNDALADNEIITFEFVIPNTAVKVRKQLQIFNEQVENVFDWIKEFRLIATNSNWDSETSLNVLKNILEPNIGKHVCNESDTEKIFEIMVSQKYPASDAHFYRERVRKLKQIDFCFIKDYVTAIYENIRRYNSCLSLKNTDILRQEQEVFFNGLDDLCRIRFAAEGITDMHTIIKRIEEVEQLLVEYSYNTECPTERN
ncbi:hypothetical protein EDEG_04243, partial [Edhazardia aedis USNM 41457]